MKHVLFSSRFISLAWLVVIGGFMCSNQAAAQSQVSSDWAAQTPSVAFEYTGTESTADSEIDADQCQIPSLCLTMPSMFGG